MSINLGEVRCYDVHAGEFALVEEGLKIGGVRC